MTYLQVNPEELQSAAPSFKSYVVGDLNTGLTNVTSALSGTLGSVSVIGPFASEIEEIITGIRGVLECLDNALNRAYIGLQNAGTSYHGLDIHLTNTLNQIDSTLSVFLGYQRPLPPPHVPGWVVWGGIILGEGVIDVLTLGAATPEELALDGGLVAGSELGADALGAGATSGALIPGSAQMLRELYALAA
ncbi:MAG TPA: hypothetical protein VFV38_42080 [Ktedonobacteraceae bacterium]|nr:hypothetical protein [Ktedonobacteraceae bacterium]